MGVDEAIKQTGFKGSHLFQRVASFLQFYLSNTRLPSTMSFSSLSESGFIPTELAKVFEPMSIEVVLISFREWLHSYGQ